MCSGGILYLVVWCMSHVGYDEQVHSITMRRIQGRYSSIISTEMALKRFNGTSDMSTAVMEGDACASVIVESSPPDELACVWTWHELCDRRIIGCTMTVGSLSGPFSALHRTLSVIGIVLLMMSVPYVLQCQCHLLCVRRSRGTCVTVVIGYRESFVWQKLMIYMGGQTQIVEQTICESTLNSVSGSCLMSHDDFCDDIRRSHDAVTLCVKKG